MKYPKIQSLFKRDKDNKFVIIPGMYSEPIFEYIDRWTVSEKIHGMNIRIMYEYNLLIPTQIVENRYAETLKFGGRIDNTQLPVFFYEKLMQLFDKEKLREVFVKDHPNRPERNISTKVVLFGEGYGNKIQKGGGNYISDGVDFALFDIYVFESNLDRSVRGWWLSRAAIADIAKQLNITMAPIDNRIYTKAEIIQMVQHKEKSWLAENEEHIAEGIVARADPPILFRNGHPVCFKLKVEDYTKLEASEK